MKKSLYIILFLLVSLSMSAMPAWRGEIEKKLPDGSTIMVTLQGDRYLHYYTSSDGRWWTEQDGVLYETEPQDEEQIETLRLARRRITRTVNQATPLNIAPRGLVILANFHNVKFKSTNTLEDMTEMLNGENYTFNNATGSARQYFIDQSRGMYTPHFDVVGPVELTQNYGYYGEDDKTVGYDGEDLRACDMVAEACRLADSVFDVDFTKYDCDNDGEVDFVYVIYAGFGQAEGAPTNTVWPHAYWLSDFHGEVTCGINCMIDGKKVNTYACGPELKGSTGSTRSGIGTFCHEFSHVLGLPDLYITLSSSGHRTMGSWDILDYGPYNNGGRTPPAYSAYERFFCGWIKPYVLNSAGTYELPDIKSTGAAAIITSTGTSNLIGNDPNPTEFYLLENRQKTGWDKYLKGHGLMITKIRYNYKKWYDNVVNDTKSNMGVDIIEADGNDDPESDYPTDLYPAGADSFTPYSTYPITNIKETGGLISLDFMGGGKTIQLATEEIEEEERIEAIYNIFGQMVSSKRIEDLPMGVYLIKTNIKTKKISIQ